MKYILNEKDRKPLYIQLYEQIKSDIVNGVIEPGSKLVSKRIISEELNVSVITVEHSYSLLVDEGYVIAKEKSGYYVSYDSDQFISKHGIENTQKSSIPFFHSSDKQDFPFDAFAKKMRLVISDYGTMLLEKSPNNGTKELREAICSYLNRFRGISTSASNIIIGAGAEYLYSLIIQLLGRDMIYGIEMPSYEKIEQVYKANKVKYRPLRLEDDGICISDLQATDADVLHVTPYHSFPTGITASPAKRKEYIRWAEKTGGYIIEDDFDSEFSVISKPIDTIFATDKSDRVIYLNTFSSTVAPSIRIGYMILPDKLCRTFEETLGFYSCTVPVFDQYVLAEFLNSGEFERHINRRRRKLRSELSRQSQVPHQEL